MRGVQNVMKGDKLYAIVAADNAASDEKYNFLTDPSEPLQLGINLYESGDEVRSHFHVPQSLHIETIQEFILIQTGRARLHLFDESRQPIGDFELGAGDAVLLLAGGHGLEFLERTKLLEIKQGPFLQSGAKLHF